MKPRLAIVLAFVMTAIYTKAQDRQAEGTSIPGPQSKQPVAKLRRQNPNIIFILADDLGFENLGCDGGQSYQTPNLDAMAVQGLRFTQVHSCPNCSPSRFELMTGVYNFRNYTKWGVMSTSNRTFGNVLHEAGYKTGIFGKWQLDGGDTSVHAFGFDDYIIYDPLRTTTDNEDSAEDGSRYKNPHLYANGRYLSAKQMNGKYGDDVMVDSLTAFIKRNKHNKFFAYYTMISPHTPFTPTPDDVAFSTWDPNLPGDTSMYPSMIKYLDKKVGQILKLVDRLGIADNTIILFTGDNGTSRKIYSSFDDINIEGGKGTTLEYGTHVPLLVKWQNHTPVGVDTSLIDFTDFYPTLADIANAPRDSLDGISFYPQVTGKKGVVRSSIFCSFQKNPAGNTPVYRWAQDRKFKLYDSTDLNGAYLFYDIVHNIKETNPIPDSLLTPQKAKIKHQLLEVINNYALHTVPVLSNPIILKTTDSSVIIKDSVLINGGTPVTVRGVVWDTMPNPQLSSGTYTAGTTSTGSFIDYITGLKVNTTYYIRAYARNFAGTAYSDQIIIKTPSEFPVATKATRIDSDRFTANWDVYGKATYRLDVSTSPTFTKINTPTITEGLNDGITPPAGWTISSNMITSASSFGVASPSLKFTASKTQVITKQLNGPATQLQFWIKGLNTNKLSSLLVEGFDGNDWAVITTLTNLPKTGVNKIFNTTSNPPLSQNFIQFRFTYTKKEGTLAFDDVSINYNDSVPFFVPGYNNLLVKTNSKIVAGLKAATGYYYRVRAVKGGTTSGNSNVITVTTNKPASIHLTDTAAENNSLSIANNSNLKAQIFPNPSRTEFILMLQTSKNEKPEITVTDMYGKEFYRATGGNNSKYVFGKIFPPGVYVVRVIQGKNIQTIKVIKAE